MIWKSILGVAPFALALPFASLCWTTVLTVLIGLILSSAFAAILVCAQELIPGRIGVVFGLFFGFAFGIGGLGVALFGVVAHHTSIASVDHRMAFLRLPGIVAALLPNVERRGAGWSATVRSSFPPRSVSGRPPGGKRA